MIIEPDQLYYEEGHYVWSPERCEAAWEQCYRDLAEALRTRPVRKVVILVGLPGCGKSHWTRAHHEDDVVIFDGLFVQRERRRRVLAIAQEAGVPVEAVWFTTDWAACVDRNGRRSPDRKVPEEALERMRQVLEGDPPTAAEGFAEVRRYP
jgi:predicted kinase